MQQQQQTNMTLKGGTSQACAVCKYQRRNCSSDCVLAPYFPPDQPKMFQNAHKLFGVSNIVKIIKKVTPAQKEEAMRSIIFQANIRERYPVHGCWGVICQMNYQIWQVEEELHAVYAHLEMYRQQQQHHRHQNKHHQANLAEDVPSQLELGMAPPQPCGAAQQYSYSISSNIGYSSSYLDSNEGVGNSIWVPQHPYATNNNNNTNQMPIQSQLVASQPLAAQEVQDYDDMHPFFYAIDDRQSFVEIKEPYESSFEESMNVMEGRECDGGNKSKPDYKYNPPSSDYQELPGGEESQARVASTVEFEQYHTDLRGSLCSINFCLLFGSMLFGFGSGVATTNNIGQIGQSLGYTSTETNSMVSLFTVWIFLGHMASGYVSDIFLHRYHCGRPLFIATTLSAMAIGNLIIAFGFPKGLYIGLLLIGLSFGSQLSLVAAVTSEIFSLAHSGTVFKIIGIAAPVGSYIFSVRVMGYFYDIAATRNDDGNNTCFGTHCFMPSLIIMAAVAVIGMLFALALFFRTRRFYQDVVFRRLHRS